MRGWQQAVLIALAALLAGALGVVASVAIYGPGPLLRSPLGQRLVATWLAQPPPPGVTVVAVGEPMPPLTLNALAGPSETVPVPGRATLINYWASWCGPCREELPLMQQLSDAAGDRVRVLGVVSKDGEPQAESFAADAGTTFPSAFDGDGELMAQLGLNALPYTMFLDADGRLVHSELGPVESVDELEQLVAEHLGVRL